VVVVFLLGVSGLLSCLDARALFAGKNKPVIKKAMTELKGAPFLKFAEQRERWALEDCYRCPGEWPRLQSRLYPLQIYTGDQKVEPHFGGRSKRSTLKSLTWTQRV
jgi:hypothetical protein